MYFLVLPAIAPNDFRVKRLSGKLTRGVVSSWALQWRSRSEDDADTKQTVVLIFLFSFRRLVQRGVTVTSCTMTTQKQKKKKIDGELRLAIASTRFPFIMNA